MRSRNAIKNLCIYLLYEVMVFILGMVFPRYIILTYGSEINGLTSTITRVLSLINLVQAGAVGAAIYQMYKPVNDNETQSSIIYSSRRFYNKILVIYSSLALIGGLFYSFHLRSDKLSFWEIFISFIILACNGSFALYYNSICDIFISPHQKKYYLTFSAIINQVVYYSLLTVVLLLKLHFICIYLSILLGGITGAVLNIIFYKKLSKGIITSNPRNKNYVIPDRKYLMLSSIGSEAVTISPQIIISTFIGLAYTSVFSVYSMVFTSMKTLLNSVQLSLSAIFGNLVKTSDDEHIYEVYDSIQLFTICVGTVLSFCVGFLMIPFVKIYIHGVTDIDYVYPLLAFFTVAYTLIFTFRTSFSYVATVYGLFKFTCTITLVFGAIGIVLSIVCSLLFGLPYVMIGLLVNQLGCACLTLYILKKKVAWFKYGRLFVRTILMLSISLAGVALQYILNISISTFSIWACYGLASAIGVSVIVLMYCYIFERKQLNSLFSYLRAIVRK